MDSKPDASVAMQSDAHEDNKYVAHFDMLGFKTAVLRDVDEAWGALSDLRSAMDKIHSLELEIAEPREFLGNRVRTYIFSDSILAFTPTGTYRDLVSILVLTAELYKNALNKCVPLRGGIAFGEFRYNFDLHLFCGPALVKAYSLGEQAQWMGIVVAPEVAGNYRMELLGGRTNLRAATGEPVIRQWDVPLKRGDTERQCVVNWPAIFRQNFMVPPPIEVGQWYEAFRRLHGEFADLPDEAQLKHVNTVRFVNACLSEEVGESARATQSNQ